MFSPRVICLFTLVFACIGAVFAIDDATVRFDRIEAAGFDAREVRAAISLTDENPSLDAQIGTLIVRASGQSLRDVRVSCASLRLDDDRVGCRGAQVQANVPVLGIQQMLANIDYDRRTGDLALELSQVKLGDGTLALSWQTSATQWHARVALDDVAIERLAAVATELKLPHGTLTGSGQTTMTVVGSGTLNPAFAIAELKIDGDLTALSLNNETGTIATDQLSLTVNARLQRRGSAWMIDGGLRSNGGQAYFEPMFLDFGLHAIDVTSELVWDEDEVSFERFHVRHNDVLDAQGSAQIVLGQQQPLRALDATIGELRFPGAYVSYMQPLLLDTNFKSMTTTGSMRGDVKVSDGEPQRLDLTFDKLSVDDGAKTLVLRDLSGRWRWHNEADDEAEDEVRAPSSPSSQLTFAGGVLLGLELGASNLNFNTVGRHFRLLEPTRIPVFDGAIQLDSFRIRNAATPKVAFMVDATIHPISVPQLCRAFGWPEFGGQLSGIISKLRLRDGVVTLGTTLEARVFDGVVRLSDLRLEDALGQWPRFYANIGIENLDLELVTGAFEFGRITGRLSGAIAALRMFNWTPVAFEASLFTPKGDRSRHRISQRAVANIGNLGGGGAGVTAALSSGFLKFFDDFNYDRLGISCRLVNEVCYMDGVAPAANGGYYLVKGKGVPRIDVIANSRRVDWPRLVSQLVAATQSGGPVVD